MYNVICVKYAIKCVMSPYLCKYTLVQVIKCTECTEIIPLGKWGCEVPKLKYFSDIQMVNARLEHNLN